MAGRLSSRNRFVVAYLLLGATVGTVLGVFIVLVQRPAPVPPPPWSSWQPGSTSVDTQVLEIADHVGSAYRLPSGDQLTAVKVGPPGPGGESLRAIGIPLKPKPATLADFQRYEESESVIYLLCGAGKDCKINEGKATKARGVVLRREALELALYTFQYANPVENVLVFFPPGPGETKVSSTLFFQRKDLTPSLDRPLRKTLPRAVPPVPGKLVGAERKTVDELTGSNLYLFRGIVGAPGYGNMVVIQPAA
jgi:hypothetical protein